VRSLESGRVGSNRPDEARKASQLSSFKALDERAQSVESRADVRVPCTKRRGAGSLLERVPALLCCN
jgi:hypothetical protein